MHIIKLINPKIPRTLRYSVIPALCIGCPVLIYQIGYYSRQKYAFVSCSIFFLCNFDRCKPNFHSPFSFIHSIIISVKIDIKTPNIYIFPTNFPSRKIANCKNTLPPISRLLLSKLFFFGFVGKNISYHYCLKYFLITIKEKY